MPNLNRLFFNADSMSFKSLYLGSRVVIVTGTYSNVKFMALIFSVQTQHPRANRGFSKKFAPMAASSLPHGPSIPLPEQAGRKLIVERHRQQLSIQPGTLLLKAMRSNKDAAITWSA